MVWLRLRASVASGCPGERSSLPGPAVGYPALHQLAHRYPRRSQRAAGLDSARSFASSVSAWRPRLVFGAWMVRKTGLRLPVRGFLALTTSCPAVLDHVISASRPGAPSWRSAPRRRRGGTGPSTSRSAQGTRRYVTTFEGFDKPWSHLERLLEGFTAKSLALGAVYLGYGRVPAGHDS